MYDLSKEEWETIEESVECRQMNLIRYWGGSGDKASDYIGDFSPVLLMHDDRKEEVIEDYRDLMERVSGAMKKLRP